METTIRIMDSTYILEWSEDGIITCTNKRDPLGHSHVVGVIKEILIRGRLASVVTTPNGDTAIFRGSAFGRDKTAVQAVCKQWFNYNCPAVSDRFTRCPKAKEAFNEITGE